MYGEAGRYLYHYSTSEAAFQHIVPTRRLRMSPLAQMRDPVENKDWVQVRLTGPGWSVEEIARFEEMTSRVIHETKVLSFTLDGSSEGRPPEHARGYARPRMWEQYGGRHEGVCLIFDRQRLEQTFAEKLAHYDVIAEEVVYSDVALAGHEQARSLNAAALAVEGTGELSRGLAKHVKQHARELFFRKLSDWTTEQEFRWLVLDKEPGDIYIDYRESLSAIVVGEKFPNWQLPGAAQSCRLAGAKLRQIRWGTAPPMVFDPARNSSQS